MERVVYCHMCLNAHVEWATGPIWQCRRCNFRIPAAHVWFPHEAAQTGEKPQHYEQEAMEL